MITLRRMVLIWALMAVAALTGSTSSWSEDKKSVLQSFEGFQHHFNQHQGRHRLVLLADPG